MLVKKQECGINMNIKKAKEILGDRATWELQNMKKALSLTPLLNSPEENERLEALDVYVLRNVTPGGIPTIVGIALAVLAAGNTVLAIILSPLR